MPQIGDIAPDFELPNQDGKLVKLSDFHGKKVVIFVFPKADSVGCNAQACGFRDEFETINSSNAVILAVGPQPVAEMREWKTKKNLPYEVLSDTEKKMLQPWGVWGVPLFGLVTLPLAQRAYWVIDETGRVIDAKVPVGPGDSVRRALQAVNIEVAPSTPRATIRVE